MSYVGTAIASLSLIAFVFLLLLHTFTGAAQSPYAGILLFLVVPMFVVLGVALVPLGMLREWRHRRRTGHSSLHRFPILDLNRPAHQNALVLFSTGSVLFLLLTIFGSYRAYEVTESVAFCGAVCHPVMEPEYTAYQHSPHARVACVDCHVGPGADWYVKSKLSGAYQLYAVLTDEYPRPIPAPITSLRPAQQTCEQCHWPRQFYGEQHKRLVHYLSDETNIPWTIEMLVKTGGGNPAGGPTEGIHWHMNVANQVEYIATDPERQEIPWVRMTDRQTGEVTEYESTEDPLTEEERGQATIRTMDCMDCHNRPTHIFRSPRRAVNLDIQEGRIDSGLPFVKRESVRLLTASYPSKAAGLDAVARGLREFYESEHPEVAARRGEAIDGAGEALREIYRRNFFPEMNVRWDTYADNIGHLDFPGCTRCHDGLHESEGGELISADCDTCHLILGQGVRGAEAYASDLRGLEFRHPEDIGGAWQFMPCHDCHTGALP